MQKLFNLKNLVRSCTIQHSLLEEVFQQIGIAFKFIDRIRFLARWWLLLFHGRLRQLCVRIDSDLHVRLPITDQSDAWVVGARGNIIECAAQTATFLVEGQLSLSVGCKIKQDTYFLSDDHVLAVLL